MSESDHPNIETLFSKLDKWRNLAGYPLEPRVDALIGLFLPRVIEECCEIPEMHTLVIPQFPLKQPGTNRSDRVDFFALSKDRGQAYLVEVKTDMGSLRPAQGTYLKRVSDKPLNEILTEIVKIAAASSSQSRKKYFHLLHALCEMGLMSFGNELKDKIRRVETAGTTKLIREIKVCAGRNLKPVVVFVQPRDGGPSTKGDFRCISFDEVAGVVESCGKLGEVLAKYLKRWKTDAGTSPPCKA